MMLHLYNTLTHKKEEFRPLKPPEVAYYSCGPTVYDFAHIGHARTYVFADTLQRVLEFNGFKVKRVMNVTDVGHLTSDSDTGDDKMEKAAKKEQKSIWEIAKFYTEDFFQMTDRLNIKRPETICRATDHIGPMVQMIGRLEKKGFTYRTADGVYFDTSKFSEYGKLTGSTFSELQKTLKAGARVEVAVGKKHPTDFALWKLTPPGVVRQMEWDSPWGRGFPGWHIECSAMSMKYLGETIDIHTGGVDHVPIHHTNEIAQSEAASGKQFVKYWLHADYLLVDGAKMSKSLGNFYRVSDIEKKGFDPLALRYLFLTASYRQQMNFTWKSLEAAQNAYSSLTKQVGEIKRLMASGERVSLSEEKLAKIDQYRDKFTQAVNDDLNTAEGISVLWKVIKSSLPSGDKYDLVILFDEVLGLGIKNIGVEQFKIPEKVTILLQKRENFRKEKKYLKADTIRKDIEKEGFVLEDTPSGPKITHS